MNHQNKKYSKPSLYIYSHSFIQYYFNLNWNFIILKLQSESRSDKVQLSMINLSIFHDIGKRKERFILPRYHPSHLAIVFTVKNSLLSFCSSENVFISLTTNNSLRLCLAVWGRSSRYHLWKQWILYLTDGINYQFRKWGN